MGTLKTHSSDDPSHHSTEQVYIITNDIGQRVEGLRLLGLETPSADDNFFADFHSQLSERISVLVPEAKVVMYDMKQLSERIWAEAMRIQNGLKNSVVISSCADISSVRHGHTIEINRIVDKNGRVIGLGPRPGNMPLGKQFNGLATVADGNPTVLVEDGTFTGGTLEYILNEFQKRGVDVAAIVVGICFPGALAEIRSKFKGEIIIIKEIPNPYEWMPDHDFMPFVPNCGRVFGAKFGDDILPHYTHDGNSYSFPYVRPFGDLEHWASIPEKKGEFSRFCLEKSLELFRMLEKMNGRRIRIGDVAGAVPRISIPMSVGHGQLPEVEYSITSFLSDVIQEF